MVTTANGQTIEAKIVDTDREEILNAVREAIPSDEYNGRGCNQRTGNDRPRSGPKLPRLG